MEGKKVGRPEVKDKRNIPVTVYFTKKEVDSYKTGIFGIRAEIRQKAREISLTRTNK